MSTLNIALIGNGRMGKMIESVCQKEAALNVSGVVGPGDCELLEEIEMWTWPSTSPTRAMSI